MADTKDLAKAEETGLEKYGMNAPLWKKVRAKTPAKYIKKRPGRGGTQLDYVEGHYMKAKLNETFNGMWSFDVTNEEVGKTQVWVKGVLTVYIPKPNGDLLEIRKTQYGGQDIKKNKSTGMPISVSDDLKAAATDALKKCASEWGFASDVYWQNGDDSTEEPEESMGAKVQASKEGHPTEKQIGFINALCSDKNYDREKLKEKYGVKSLKELSYQQGQDAINFLQSITEDIPF